MKSNSISSYGFRCRKPRVENINKGKLHDHSTNVLIGKRKIGITEAGDAHNFKKRAKNVQTLTPAINNRDRDIKSVLSTAIDDQVVCRNQHMEDIQMFVNEHLDQAAAGSMYVSGAPGTGKTLCMKKIVVNNEELRKKARVLYINCMSFQKSQCVYNHMLSQLLNSEVTYATNVAMQKLRNLCSQGSMIILVIDEIDQLECKGQEVLYTLFELPSLPRSKLVLIGVANSLDLTDRTLPRLRKLHKYVPKLLHFPPYTKDEIVNILESRQLLVSDKVTTCIDKTAIEYCARKVSAVSGDVRKALDICRRAVEITEKDVTLNSLSDRISDSPKKVVRVGDIAGIISDVYGSKIMSTVKSSDEPTIPLQQKLLVGALLVSLKRIRGMKEITVAKLFETYRDVCKRRQIQAVYESEIVNLCSLLETRGILRLKCHKEVRLTKVRLAINETEVAVALKDQALVSSILSDM